MKKEYDITIAPEIISELKRLERRITELTDGDDKLVGKIVEYSLMLGKGKGIYSSSVENLIWKEYPDIRTAPELEGKSELFTLIYKLATIITLKHIISKKELDNIPCEEWLGYKGQVREKIEQEILKIFYPGDYEVEEKHEIDIIGEVTTQFDNMDI